MVSKNLERILQPVRCVQRSEVQGRLNDLLHPYRSAQIVPALRESGATVRELITEVQAVLPRESSATPHLEKALDEAVAIEDEGTALGKILDLFLFREVRGAVEQVLRVKVSDGNGG